MPEKIILALGADMKNRFLFTNGKRLIFGPDLGDLGDVRNFEIFKKEIGSVTKKSKPRIIAHDLHPGYFSTKLASVLCPPVRARRIISVQHHHAHIASVIYEHDLKKPLIGVSFDGTGFGADGNMWGGEFLLVEKTGFKRLAHLSYNKMPGGDKVVFEPWRMAVSVLGEKAIPFLRHANKNDKNAVLFMMSKNINSPLTSSAGRIFDACAALLGICEFASYEAEGPIKLEAICENGVDGAYEFRFIKNKNNYMIDTKPLFLGVIKDLKKGKRKSYISAKFHNSVAYIVIYTAKKLSKNLGIKDIALSGGVFQNRYLNTKILKGLPAKLKVFRNEKTPINDLNISLGQYWISRSLRNNKE